MDSRVILVVVVVVLVFVIYQHKMIHSRLDSFHNRINRTESVRQQPGMLQVQPPPERYEPSSQMQVAGRPSRDQRAPNPEPTPVAASAADADIDDLFGLSGVEKDRYRGTEEIKK